MTDDRLTVLADAVRAQRTHMDANQIDIAKSVELSGTTWQQLESGVKVSPRTMHRASRALLWEPDQAERILAGEEPPELIDPPEPTPDEQATLTDVLTELRELRAIVERGR